MSYIERKMSKIQRDLQSIKLMAKEGCSYMERANEMSKADIIQGDVHMYGLISDRVEELIQLFSDIEEYISDTDAEE